MKKLSLILSLLCLYAAQVQAQAPCPVAAGCTPGSATSPSAIAFGAGIVSVQIGSATQINKTSGNYADGYQDYSCTDTATAFVGSPLAVSVNTGPLITEKVRIWVDYNNNGTFETPQELVFSSNDKFVHTGSFTPPSTAVTGSYLRIRVAADANTAPNLTPCSTPAFSQTEDYGIQLISNINPPIAGFTASPLITCTGIVNFTDQSQNAPVTWDWNFGDNSTSSQPSPQHTYTQSGVYTVTLIVSNSIGSDTLTKTNYISYNDTVPLPASCTPITTAACCGYGILNFSLGAINSTSGNSTEGYRDFTCSRRTDLLLDKEYAISMLTSATLEQDTRIWLDMNNNGSFEASELIFQALDSINPQGTIILPSGSGIRLDTALRLRISSDFTNSTATGPCNNVTLGQVEDYTVIVRNNPLPPIVQFGLTGQNPTGSGPLYSCPLTVSFNPVIENTVTSYSWDFGDMGTSTQASPAHTYTTAGSYSVKLIVTGPAGADTLTRLLVVGTPPVVSTCNSPTLNNGNLQTGIVEVNFADISNTSQGGLTGYEDFSCFHSTVVKPNTAYQLDITVLDNVDDVAAWIDYNNDGNFTVGERIMVSGNPTFGFTHRATINISGAAAQGVPLRMRVLADNFLPLTIATPCYSITNGQAEDYTIYIASEIVAPTADFEIDSTNICNSGQVSFINRTQGLVTGYQWTIGINASTSVDPVLTLSPGTYNIELIAFSPLGNDTINKPFTLYAGPLATNCAAPTQQVNATPCGITNVQLANLNNSSGDAASEGYRDFTCLAPARLTEGETYTLSVQVIAPDEALVAWIDYNNNAQFEINERIALQQSPNLFSPNIYQVSFTVPLNTVPLNTSLRMRIIGDRPDYDVADGSCYNIFNGQAEDYSVLVLPDSVPPVADFGIDSTTICTGSISFINLTTGLIDSVLWNFDNTTSSTDLNPQQALAPGNYSIELIAFSSLGNDTITKNLVVGPPITITTCAAPTTLMQGGGSGTQRVQFGSIDFTTGDGFEGYGDFACSQIDTVTQGFTYTLTVTVFDGTEDVVAWIDYNDDGQFAVSERVMLVATFGTTKSASVSIPATADTSKVLRMRIISDLPAYNPANGACYDIANGQAEDYGIYILPGTLPPVADFDIDATAACNGGPVSFTNTTNGVASTFFWDFGNSNTSNLENPQHTFTQGSYTVTFIVSGPLGSDTVAKTININAPVLPAFCTATTGFAQANVTSGIFNVQFGSIDNSSSGAVDNGPLQDFTCVAQAVVLAGSTYPLSIQVGNPTEDAVAWIDYNNNGQFETTEQVFIAGTPTGTPPVHTGSVTIPATAIRNTPLRMRIISDWPAYDPANGACFTINNGQAEDYAIVVAPDTVAPTAIFDIDSTSLCGNAIRFLNQTTGYATSYFWDFGNGDTSVLQSPQEAFVAGTYTITMIAYNSTLGNDTTSLTFTFYDTPLAACAAPTTLIQVPSGIRRVQFGSIDNSSLDSETEGYADFSCLAPATLMAGQGYTLNVQVIDAGEDVVAWIDYNNDGQFAATERIMLSFNAVSTNPVTHSVSVTPPATAVSNTPLRMRIITDRPNYSVADGACYDIANGQAEDYAVIIDNGTGFSSLTASGFEAFSVFPNPSEGQFTVKGNNYTEVATLTVSNLLGQAISSRTVTNSGSFVETFDISNYGSGIYLVRISNSRTQQTIKVVVK